MDRRRPTLYADGRDFHNLVCDRHQVWNGLEGHSRKHCVETGDNDALICANQLVNKVNDCLVEELRLLDAYDIKVRNPHLSVEEDMRLPWARKSRVGGVLGCWVFVAAFDSLEGE
jgi:hypothetical protein